MSAGGLKSKLEMREYRPQREPHMPKQSQHQYQLSTTRTRFERASDALFNGGRVVFALAIPRLGIELPWHCGEACGR